MTMPLGRILIADPFAVVRRGIKLLIDNQDGYRVVAEAGDGREALRLVRETDPNIVVMDLPLRELNGLELAYQIRRLSPRTEILVYSDCNRENVIVAALKSGVRGFVSKSDANHCLIAALKCLTQHRPYFSDVVSEVLLEHLLHSEVTGPDGLLTRREREIVQLICEGRINKEVAYKLDISVKTVETHRASAMQKLGLRSTADLVRFAIRNDIVHA